MRGAILGAVALLATLASPSLAQEELPFLDALSGLSYSQCTEALGARKVAFARLAENADVASKTLQYVVEAHRHECEMLRMASEVERLAGQQERLTGEIQRLDDLWAVESAADTSLVDYDGRRHSQEVMQQNIAEMGDSIANLRLWLENSRLEARRIFALAIASAAEADEAEASLVLAASTTDAQNDVLERILGKERPKLAQLLALSA